METPEGKRIPTDDDTLASIVFGADSKEVEKAELRLEKALLPAVASLTDLALYSPNDRVRLDASRYIVDRKLGPVSKMVKEGAADKLKELLEAMNKAD